MSHVDKERGGVSIFIFHVLQLAFSRCDTRISSDWKRTGWNEYEMEWRFFKNILCTEITFAGACDNVSAELATPSLHLVSRSGTC